MKTIIAGSRHFQDYALMCRSLEPIKASITEVVSGKARGADTLGERWAKENGIPVKEFPAEWAEYGRAAGPIRNGQMAIYADQLVAFLAPNSKGTANMIRQAEKGGLVVHVVNFTENQDE